MPTICITSLHCLFMCVHHMVAVREFVCVCLSCQHEFTQSVIPTYFLTLPNSIWEDMFGITLLCNLCMLGSLRVCRRSSRGLSLALSHLSPRWARVQTPSHLYLFDFGDISGFDETHLSPRWAGDQTPFHPHLYVFADMSGFVEPHLGPLWAGVQTRSHKYLNDFIAFEPLSDLAFVVLNGSSDRGSNAFPSAPVGPRCELAIAA